MRPKVDDPIWRGLAVCSSSCLYIYIHTLLSTGERAGGEVGREGGERGRERERERGREERERGEK